MKDDCLFGARLREFVANAKSVSWKGDLGHEETFRKIFPPETIRIEGGHVIAEFALSGDDNDTDAICEYLTKALGK